MIGNKYIIESKVGEGKFGQVFRGFYWKRGVDVATNTGVDVATTCGVDVATNLKVQVAIKIEGSNAILKTLRHEATLLHYLYERGCRKTPIVYWYGIVDQNPALIMPYYEMSLEYYVEHIVSDDHSGSVKWFRSMVEILETIHSHYVIHRDIKPANFMLRGATGEIVLIDFGLATVFVDENNRHFPPPAEPKTTIIGTPKYISYNIHIGEEPSRRDDLISVGYVLLWMMLRSLGQRLPWETNNGSDSHDYGDNGKDIDQISHPRNQELAKHKSWTSIEASMDPRIMPELGKYFNDVYSLKYSEDPKYQEYMGLSNK